MTTIRIVSNFYPKVNGTEKSVKLIIDAIMKILMDSFWFLLLNETGTYPLESSYTLSLKIKSKTNDQTVQ